MQIVVGIRFKSSGKIYYFDPAGIDFEENEGAIVETARGVEFGKIVFKNMEVEDDKIIQPLKQVMRKANLDDVKRLAINMEMKGHSLISAREKIGKHNLPMKVVDLEYTFDRQKVIIYFTAESRIDFRDLVKELAGTFKVRIELRQIYERDDTKMRGGLGPCGRACCCSNHLPEFEKVSVKMAKLQGLSLNPTKISGLCGRLMCCLKYENEYYEETSKKMPALGSEVGTVNGRGVVIGISILKQEAKVRIATDDGSYDINSYSINDIQYSKQNNFKQATKNDKKEDDLPAEERAQLKKLDDDKVETVDQEKPRNKPNFKNNSGKINNKVNFNANKRKKPVQTIEN